MYISLSSTVHVHMSNRYNKFETRPLGAAQLRYLKKAPSLEAFAIVNT